MISPDEGPRAAPSRAVTRGHDGDRSVGELFSELANETSVLVRQEVQLAAKEVTQKATYAARQAALPIHRSSRRVMGIAKARDQVVDKVNEMAQEAITDVKEASPPA